MTQALQESHNLLSQQCEISELYRDEAHRLNNELAEARALLVRQRVDNEEAMKNSDIIREKCDRIIAEHNTKVLTANNQILMCKKCVNDGEFWCCRLHTSVDNNINVVNLVV